MQNHLRWTTWLHKRVWKKAYMEKAYKNTAKEADFILRHKELFACCNFWGLLYLVRLQSSD